MIPKVIHYCWFGRNPKPELLQRCIASWKRYCPDYKIIEWNEDNFDITQNDYAREAYEAKKWAFVTDYARLRIVYNHGGIYLDTDVEVIRPFDDLLDEPAFFGFEDNLSVNTGLGFGAEKGNPVVKAMLADYGDAHFRLPDGRLDKLPCPVRNTKSILHLLPHPYDGRAIIRTECATFYPAEYFCPLSSDGLTMKKTRHTYSIHWFSATWLSEEERIVHNYRIFRGKCEKLLGKTLGGYFVRAVYLLFPRKRDVLKRH